MFRTLTRIAVALERLVELKTREVALLQSNQELMQATKAANESVGRLIAASNDRAVWYHSEASQLKTVVGQLQTKVQRLEVFQ